MTPYIIYFIAKFTNLSCTPYYLLHRLFIIDFDLPLWEPKVPCLNPRNDISWFVFYISWFMFISLFHIIKRKLIFARFLSIRHNHFWPRTRMDLSLGSLSSWTIPSPKLAEIGTGKTGQGWLLRKRLNEYEPECCENRKVSRQVALNVKALYSLLFFAYALAIIRPSRDLILEKKHSVTKKKWMTRMSSKFTASHSRLYNYILLYIYCLKSLEGSM